MQTARQIGSMPVAADVDVLVVGGGPAGVAAGLAAVIQTVHGVGYRYGSPPRV